MPCCGLPCGNGCADLVPRTGVRQNLGRVDPVVTVRPGRLSGTYPSSRAERDRFGGAENRRVLQSVAATASSTSGVE